MLLWAISNYPQIFFNLLALYLVLCLINPHNFFSQRRIFAELYFTGKLKDWSLELSQTAYESKNKYNFYYYSFLSYTMLKLAYISEAGFSALMCSVIRADKFFLTLFLLTILFALLPLIITCYWVLIVFWLLKILYYLLLSKFNNMKFILTYKDGINRLNPITFNKDEILIPVNCKTHDFIPKYFQSFKTSSLIAPVAYFGPIKVENQTLWNIQPFTKVAFSRVLLNYVIEFLVRIIFKRPYIWAFGLWGRIVSIIWKVNENETLSSLLYNLLKSFTCLIIIGVPLFIIDLNRSIIVNIPLSLWSGGTVVRPIQSEEELRTAWHKFVVKGVFMRFRKEAATILYATPFPVDVDNITPL